MGTPHPEGLTSQHVDLSGIRDDPAFATAVALGTLANEALEHWRETGDWGDHDAWRRAKAAYAAERDFWRNLGVALGTRVTADVVSHLDADGNPDQSTREGAAYWADVAAAAEAGVPNAFGPQR